MVPTELPTLAVPLREPKSPPGVVQELALKKRKFHVASPGVAGSPTPPGTLFVVPSPHAANTGCSSNTAGVLLPEGLFDTVNASVTELIVAPAGMPPPAMSKRISALRNPPEDPVRPAKSWPKALLLSLSLYIELSRLGSTVTTAARASKPHPAPTNAAIPVVNKRSAVTKRCTVCRYSERTTSSRP